MTTHGRGPKLENFSTIQRLRINQDDITNVNRNSFHHLVLGSDQKNLKLAFGKLISKTFLQTKHEIELKLNIKIYTANTDLWCLPFLNDLDPVSAVNPTK